MKLKNVKDRLKDETLDLSLCDLEEVPVREIATIRKAAHLDLSNNLLVSLPTTFASLRQIVKLDLSKNMLTEIPENFGEMKQLKHLDLYANQISRLPLSLSELKNLRWLDLKENPLTPAVATVAGSCSNLSECQACARNIVNYLSYVKESIEKEKQRRLNTATAEVDTDGTSSKKENKKKKKKLEKENKKNSEKNGTKVSRKVSQANKNDAKESKPLCDETFKKQEYQSKGKATKGWCRIFVSLMSWLFLLSFAFFLTIVILPLYSEQHSEVLTDYVEVRTGMPVKMFQKQCIDTLHLLTQNVSTWTTSIYHALNDAYEKHFKAKASPSER